MESKDLRKKSLKELQQLLATTREKVRELRFSVSNKQLKNIREIRTKKVEIARILTIIKEKNNIVKEK
ncbi:MAG: 50S ribosomal protein L29 [Candidatus Komeilibacteria bacterium]